MSKSKSTSTTTFSLPDKPMSVDELAQWLGVSKRYIHYQTARGHLRKISLGKTLVRILPGDVAVWLRSKRQ
jgi:excisionase family DNA binding protein